MSVHPTTIKTYADRVALHSNPTAKRILETMERKKSNLCVSVDVTTAAEALEVVRRVGKSVCMVKVGAQLIDPFIPLCSTLRAPCPLLLSRTCTLPTALMPDPLRHH